ncbi:MAG: hypothetical protein ACFFCP_14525 [Promethearchaeota archaeon]
MSQDPPYWETPFSSSFVVFVESVKQIRSQYQIQIRENVIRPAGGGQAGDKGILTVGDRSVTILDTVLDSGYVKLIADEAVPEKISGHLEIDMDWRGAMMRNHTSEHIFVSLLKKKNPGIEINDLWIDGVHGTIELGATSLSFDDIFAIESDVQRIIELDKPIRYEFVKATEIDESIRAREGLTEKHQTLRIVRIGDLDSSACSGLHVEGTGQIEFFKIIDMRETDDALRVEFVSGKRAISLTKELYNEVLRRKYSYPFEMEQIGNILDRARLMSNEHTHMQEKIRQLINQGPTIEVLGNLVFRHEYLPGFESKDLKDLANQMEIKHSTVLLLFAPGVKSQVIFRTYQAPFDAKYYVSEAIENLGGKGGGSGDNYTGGFSDVENPEELYKNLITSIRAIIS